MTRFRVAPALPLLLAAALCPAAAETPRSGAISPEFLIEADSTGAESPALVHVSWSPDGRTILCGDARGSLVVRDAAGGARLRSCAAPCLLFLGAVQTADGRILAATWGAHRIQVRDPITREVLVNFVQTARPEAAAISADGSIFALRDSKSIRIFDLVEHGEIEPLRMKPADPHPKNRAWLSLSRDGSLILANDSTAVRLLETHSGKQFVVGWSLWDSIGALSPDGSEWLTGSGTWLAQFSADSPEAAPSGWGEEADGQTRARLPIRILPQRNSQSLRLLAFSGDGRLASALHGPGTIVEVFDTWTGAFIASVASPGIVSLAFSPDGRRMATGDENGGLRVWKVPAPPPLVDALNGHSSHNLWGILACDRPERAHEAVLSLASRGDEAIEALREEFAAREKEAPVLHLAGQLDSADPATRAAARAELEWMGVLAEPGLRRALAGEITEVLRKETEALLDQAESRLSASRVNRQRRSGLRILESIGSPRALDVLQRIADDSPSPREAADANAAIDRLRARAAGGGK